MGSGRDEHFPLKYLLDAIEVLKATLLKMLVSHASHGELGSFKHQNFVLLAVTF